MEQHIQPVRFPERIPDRGAYHIIERARLLSPYFAGKPLLRLRREVIGAAIARLSSTRLDVNNNFGSERFQPLWVPDGRFGAVFGRGISGVGPTNSSVRWNPLKKPSLSSSLDPFRHGCLSSISWHANGWRQDERQRTMLPASNRRNSRVQRRVRALVEGQFRNRQKEWRQPSNTPQQR